MTPLSAAPVPLAPPLPRRAGAALARVLPGVALCGGVSLLALGAEAAEARLFGRPPLEALVLAILIGTALRTLRRPGPRFDAGVAVSARTLLELAVVLLGASLSFRSLAGVGPGLLLGIAGVVALTLPTSYGLGRILGLPRRMAALVACGNSICGNSAIAAVAPVIGAEGEDVAASIAFTAVLGVVVVVGLPALAPLLGSGTRFGVFAGLTVYAVPQVLAAAAPAGLAAVQIGTLVKLMRVLMLGPVVLALALAAGRRGAPAGRPARHRPAPHRLVPWFILGFLGLATARSLGLLPTVLLPPLAASADLLTLVSMAALGLGVDVRVVARAGLGVTAAVTLSLLALGVFSLGLIRLIGLA